MIIENKIEMLHSKFYVFQDALVIISILYSTWLDKELFPSLALTSFHKIFNGSSSVQRSKTVILAPKLLQSRPCKKEKCQNRHLIFFGGRIL